ncbi:hypothetical protein [Halorientalis pallida]|uniref:HEAT repeat-containing protein n=1 Tax=Halorientalis pallida TaxID=2479928 RepID=A0A498L3W5_9EURY|nr:hypothetical protein [Halorientalis pallida]RXK50494.1 hypothetical protein EAF64_08080 [Halorientalis pallida]
MRACAGHRPPDRVRIDAASLVVGQVLDGAADPYGTPFEDLRVEFEPDGTRSCLTVPGTPIWNSHGWRDREPGRVLVTLGELLCDALDGVADPESGLVDPLTMAVDGETVRLQWRYLTHKLGVWPVDGLRFDLRALSRSWLRDVERFRQYNGADELDSLAETVRKLASVEPATDRLFLTAPSSFDLDELRTAVLDDPLNRRDAFFALRERDDLPPAVVDRAAVDLSAADRWVLAGLLAATGDRAAIAALVGLLRTDDVESIRHRVARVLGQRIRVGSTDGPTDASETSETAGATLATTLCDGTGPSGRDLLSIVRSDDEPLIRALAADTAVTLDGESVVPSLIEALVDEPNERTRRQIALTVERADADAAARANVDATAEADDGPMRRRSLLSSSQYGSPTSRESVVATLQGDDPGVWPMAVSSATDFPDDPPYDALLDLLNRVDPATAPRMRAEAWNDALDALAELIRDEDTPNPPRGPLERLRSKGDKARRIATEGLDADR